MIVLARPHHWVKNIIIFLPTVFARRFDDPNAWLQAGGAALAFCFASSAVYILNDIHDRAEDRLHPTKKDRPLAAGQMSVLTAATGALLLAAAALGVAVSVNLLVCMAILAYFILQALYTHYLKHRMIVDVICIATGFVIRAGAGALAIRVEVSPWLVICTFAICLFMGFCKRRTEITAMSGAGAAVDHRRTLSGYTPELLTHLITLSAGIAIISYLLYASHSLTIERFGTNYLVYTLPFVVYGICRFAMLSMTGRYEDPTDLILNDRPFQITIALWFVCALFVILYGADLEQWLGQWYGSVR